MTESRSLIKSLFYGLLGIVGIIYLLNPGAGIFEILPDNIPLVGNLDEAAMVFVLGTVLEYFGVPVGSVLRKLGGRR
ncbi:MAG: DUF1232 domain-containing protein [Candidatus Altiarchaeota archaeon]